MLHDNRRDREARARAAVRNARKNADWLFTKEGNHRFYRSHMAAESVEKLVELAREGDKDALEILQEHARGARRSGVNVPRAMHEFVWECFTDGPPKAKSGPSPKDNSLRDHTIALLVMRVRDDFGFPEYTRPEHRGDPEAPMTACRLVAEEVGLNERTVEEIWAARKDAIARGSCTG